VRPSCRGGRKVNTAQKTLRRRPGATAISHTRRPPMEADGEPQESQGPAETSRVERDRGGFVSTLWLSLFDLRSFGSLALRASSKCSARVFALAVIAAIAAVGCSDDKKDGGLAVVVESDLSMPKDIDRIRFEVTQGKTLRTEDHLLGSGRLLMPAEFRLKPIGNSNPVVIRAIGYKAGVARIERSVVTSIPSDFLAMVRLPLTYLCAGTARDDDTSTCGDEQTCKVGLCESAVVNVSTLPEYMPGPWSGAESGKRDPSINDCFDVLTCFTKAFRVDVDKETCTFPIDNDDPNNISVGIKLPQGSDGICGGGTGACWIALDRGPEGWTNDGTIFMLPPALCRDSSDGSKLVIVASNMCGGKTLSTPSCGDWSSATHPSDTSESIGMMDDSVIETPGDPVGQSCAGLSFQPCGDCGQQRRTCKNGNWSEWGECLGQGVCTPNASENCGSDGMRVCLSTCDWGDCTGQTCAGMAVEACGNCGTRRRACTNGEWSEWDECENSGQCAPGTTQGCGVDGTQACMGNCQWGVCGTEVCDGAPQQACGNCGTQSRTCDEATVQWSAFAACGQEGMCEANATRVCGLRGMQTCGGNCQWDAACAGQVCEGPASQPCGMCGIQARTCDSTTGVWSGWAACSNEGQCAPGSTQACGVGGMQTCLASCMWNEECTGQLCAGEMTRSCGFCGSESRDCDGLTALWTPFSACLNQGPCNPGSTRRCGSGGTQTCAATCQWPTACTGQACTGESTQACGRCGTQSRTCDGSTGEWSVWGTCTGQGQCTPGQIDSCDALTTRTCGANCVFGACDQCVSTAAECDDQCVNLQTDSANCGACNTDCGGRPCEGGECQCESGTHDCNGTCRRNDDVNWCGNGTDANPGCTPCALPSGAPMGAIPTCPGGVCGSTCPPGTITCGTGGNLTCTANNTTSNCGACGNACTPGESCQNGQCTCPGGGRLNTVENCRTCGDVCTAPAGSAPRCRDRACDFTCNAGLTRCGDRCVGNDDETACGESCDVCTGNEQCLNGACTVVCTGQTHKCGNECIANTDPTQCGPNCTPCPAPANGAATCNANACDFTCADGRFKCATGNRCGASDDEAACGPSCTACTGGSQCVNGSCQVVCDPQQHKCGDACVSNTDPNQCGSSCTDCPAPANGAAICEDNACDFTCAGGRFKCATGTRCGASDDNSACGASCTVCMGGTQCMNGSCQVVCSAQQHKCGDVCVNNTDANNCGPECIDCPAPPGGTAACVDATCVQMCPSGGATGTDTNCSRCGDICSGGETCNGGACSCAGGGQTGTNADCARCGDTCGNDSQCVNGACTLMCTGNTHACDGACVSNGDANNCGPNCTDCPDPTNGTATCTNNACDFTCPQGRFKCDSGNRCGSNDDESACGDSCTMCPTGSQCVNGACSLVCTGNTHACDGVCVQNSDANNCGPSCVDCPDPTNGTATCANNACDFTCTGGRFKCASGNRCGANDDDDACGASCTACTGGAQCVNGSCGVVCTGQTHECDGQCVSNREVANCGTTSCNACPVPANGSATCDGTSCGIQCNDNAHECSNGTCASDSDVNRCTDSCTPCEDRPGSTVSCSNNTCVYEVIETPPGGSGGGLGEGGAGESGAGAGGAGSGGAGEGGAGAGGAGAGGAGSGGGDEEDEEAGSGGAGQSGTGAGGAGTGGNDDELEAGSGGVRQGGAGAGGAGTGGNDDEELEAGSGVAGQSGAGAGGAGDNGGDEEGETAGSGGAGQGGDGGGSAQSGGEAEAS